MPAHASATLHATPEFLREEEERLVEHAKSLTAVVAAAHAASEARNQEIYEENHRFERGRLER